MKDEHNSDEVGHGKPPKHTQFVKGQSGNPKGRPKGSQNLATLLVKIGRQRITVSENGRTRSIPKLEASMIQLMNKAVSADLKAIRLVVDLAKAVQTDPNPLTELVAAMNKVADSIGPPENDALVDPEDTETV
jgi:Family of unknown function (DUF5681)